MQHNTPLSTAILNRLATEPNIWFATIRPSNHLQSERSVERPHLVPLWFAWYEHHIYVCIAPNSVKARNILLNPYVALSLEDGSNVVICEGKATVVSKPWSKLVCDIFIEKYDWDITTSRQYTSLVKVEPQKWLSW